MLKSFLHYQIDKKLGEGGMGLVYRAHDSKLNRRVALKFLPQRVSSDSSNRQRFRKEAQAVAALNHPNIAQVYAIEEAEGELCIVMEYVEGEELREVIDRDELPIEERCAIANQIAGGIEAAHDKGIIHRDIKGRNIMLDTTGKVKIMDFGLARIQDSHHITKTGTTLGTTPYMAPEQLAGEAMDMRSDIWAFGVVLYELFTGELPFQGMYEPAIMYAITEEEPVRASERNPEIPAYLDEIIHQCLEKDKEQRYQNMSQVVDDLSAGDEGLKGKSADVTEPKKKTIPRLLKVAVLPLILLLGFFFVFSEIDLSWKSSSIPEKRYLAVLPVENIGNNPEMQAICDGLAETFSFKLSELEKYEDAYWVAPAVEMREEKVKSASRANKLFGVNLAVLSSIQTVQDSTRLILELVDADHIRRLDTKQVMVGGQNLAILEQKGVQAMLEMLKIQDSPDINRTLRKGAPKNPGAYEYYLKGRASLQDHAILDSLENAIHLFQQAISIDPEFPLAYAGLGESYWRKYEAVGEVTLAGKAESSLKKAEQLNDELAPVQTLLGLVRAGTGDFEQAIEHLNKALKIDPNFTPAYRGLANVYDQQGKMEKAVATYNYAISLNPNVWEGYNDLGSHYLRKGNFEEATELYRKVIEITPKNNHAYSNLGNSYYMQGKYGKAAEAYQMSLTLENDPTVASNLANIHFINGSYEQSAKMYQLALQALPDRYEIWANLAASYDLSGKPDMARQSYRKAIEKGLKQLEVNPNNAELMADIGAYYSDIGDSLNAQTYIRKALAINDENILIRQRAVSTFEKLGMREEALRWITAAMIADIESQPELKALVEDPRYLSMKKQLETNSEN